MFRHIRSNKEVLDLKWYLRKEFLVVLDSLVCVSSADKALDIEHRVLWVESSLLTKIRTYAHAPAEKEGNACTVSSRSDTKHLQNLYVDAASEPCLKTTPKNQRACVETKKEWNDRGPL